MVRETHWYIQTPNTKHTKWNCHQQNKTDKFSNKKQREREAVRAVWRILLFVVLENASLQRKYLYSLAFCWILYIEFCHHFALCIRYSCFMFHADFCRLFFVYIYIYLMHFSTHHTYPHIGAHHIALVCYSNLFVLIVFQRIRRHRMLIRV